MESAHRDQPVDDLEVSGKIRINWENGGEAGAGEADCGALVGVCS